MKIKRKLYPNRPDKEFVLMSVNDLKRFGKDVLETSGGSPEENVDVCIIATLSDFNLKTPASHQKKTNPPKRKLKELKQQAEEIISTLEKVKNGDEDSRPLDEFLNEFETK